MSYIYVEEKINNLETDVSVLSCGTLERSNNQYIESFVKPCVSIESEIDPHYVGLIGKKILKKG